MVQYDDKSSEFEHVCEGKATDGDYDIMFSIDDNYNKIVNELGEEGLRIKYHSGRYRITMTNVLVDTPIVTTTSETEVTVEDLGDPDSRRLGSKVGTRSLVIIRVTAGDASPTYGAADMSDAFFGTHGDPNNLKLRYALCSMNKLVFNPGTGAGFTDGVAEISITNNIVGNNVHDLVPIITNAIVAKFGNSLAGSYDHIVYALPRGTTFNSGGSNRWLAFAYVDHYLSAYNDDNIMYISNEVHETGHNLGLQHSAHGDVQYGDQSGTMGYGYGK